MVRRRSGCYGAVHINGGDGHDQELIVTPSSYLVEVGTWQIGLATLRAVVEA